MTSDIAVCARRAHASWRLKQLAKDSALGSALVLQANQILKAADTKERLPGAGLEPMAKVAQQLLLESAVNAA